MWAAPAAHFHMWMVLAVLQHHRKPLMEAAVDYDGLLKFCIQVNSKHQSAADLLLQLSTFCCCRI